MMKQLAEMLIKKGRKIRCGVGAEKGDSSAYSINIGWIWAEVL